MYVTEERVGILRLFHKLELFYENSFIEHHNIYKLILENHVQFSTALVLDGFMSFFVLNVIIVSDNFTLNYHNILYIIILNISVLNQL